ncbi:MAG TPA: NADPH:quinone reductase [Verrucomicrobiae bacterium]|jgi:NADPH2:quinone reductase|nr:NADPH:quinone reductase [Verrucomicrobiae bacterium]
MKAIRVLQFGGPEVMQLKNVPDPEPGPSQVLIHVRAVGVNPVETYIRAGRYPNLSLPFTPGTDAAGEVAKIGASVRHVSVGARVYTSGSVTGAYANMTICEAADVHPLPNNASFAEGAALGIPYGTAWRALFQRARAVPGETVLVHGASGGVGTAAVQLARAAGLRVIGTASSDRGAQLVRDLGARHVLNHGQPDYLTDVLKITENRGVDIILEMLANVNLGRDLQVLARNGRVIVIGNRGKVEIDAREAMVRDAEIRGMILFNVSAAEKVAIHAALRAGLESGTVKPVISRELPLEDAPRAHGLIMEPGASGKIILLP